MKISENSLKGLPSKVKAEERILTVYVSLEPSSTYGSKIKRVGLSQVKVPLGEGPGN